MPAIGSAALRASQSCYDLELQVAAASASRADVATTPDDELVSRRGAPANRFGRLARRTPASCRDRRTSRIAAGVGLPLPLRLTYVLELGVGRDELPLQGHAFLELGMHQSGEYEQVSHLGDDLVNPVLEQERVFSYRAARLQVRDYELLSLDVDDEDMRLVLHCTVDAALERVRRRRLGLWQLITSSSSSEQARHP